SPSRVKARPFATSGWGFGVVLPGCRVPFERPTPAALAIGWMRNASTQPLNVGSHAPPVDWIFQTRPWPVVPSPVQRLPSLSNARPFVPGTPVAKATARGGVTAFGVSFQTVAAGPPSAMYRSPFESNAMPDGLQRAAAGFGMRPTVVRVDPVNFHTGQVSPTRSRPVV